MGTPVARARMQTQRVVTADEVEGCFVTHYVDPWKIDGLASGTTRCGLMGVPETSLMYLGSVTCQLCQKWLNNYSLGTRG